MADGGRQLGGGCGVHVLAGLRRVGLKLGQRHLEELVGKTGKQAASALEDRRMIHPSEISGPFLIFPGTSLIFPGPAFQIARQAIRIQAIMMIKTGT